MYFGCGVICPGDGVGGGGGGGGGAGADEHHGGLFRGG